MESWPRQLYEPGGGDARIYYVVCGDIELDGPLYQPSYRSMGVPQGCELWWSEVEQFIESTLDFLDDPEPLRSYSNCVVLEGVVSDPPDLDYFRDIVGLITYLVGHGGKAVLDLQGQSWWEGLEWYEVAFRPNSPEPLSHVTLLSSDTEDWTYTRGLLKFGRPELSYRGPESEEMLGLFDRLIEAQVDGAVFEDGEEIALPSGSVELRRRGSLTHPDFRNYYLELRLL